MFEQKLKNLIVFWVSNDFYVNNSEIIKVYREKEVISINKLSRLTTTYDKSDKFYCYVLLLSTCRENVQVSENLALKYEVGYI